MDDAGEHDGFWNSLTLGHLDHDGALTEAAAAAYGESRAEFLRAASLAGGAVLVGAGIASGEADAASPKLDTRILNFDLVFEYLQSSFYLAAVREGTVRTMRPEKRRWANVLGAHEIAHVRILRRVLGRNAAKRPFFDFHGVTEDEQAFTRTAVAMEDLTVALLAGQAPRFSNRALTAAVFSLLTTEARHAAWARRLSGFRAVGPAFDQPKTLAQVSRTVAATRFIARRPRTMTRRRRPRNTG